ncbi:hypothetical protein TrRE_jg3159 [Triparma retinervis]|uniref:Alpha-galactosidase n=1 Tax=Triparma retinervis TaxID=2557542 RepID=A0A9W6ZZ00_9STRA|nr:hypothetical protein TrRE_jg3159 [Triparma retinervis]
MGVKLGMYTSMGRTTCEGLPASFDHIEEDAHTFAMWGIEFLKVDTCGLTLSQYFWPEPPYKKFHDQLKAVSPSLTFNVCNWGFHAPWKWEFRPDSWRTTMDIFPVWWRILQIVDFSEPLYEYVTHGAYNDWDMLECGVTGTFFNWEWTPALRPLSPVECSSHFALWAFALSPIVIGMDISNTPQQYLDIVTDENVLGLHKGGAAGRRAAEITEGFLFAPSVYFSGKVLGLLGFQDFPTICLVGSCKYYEVWVKPMEEAEAGELAVLFFNRGGTLHNARGFAAFEDISIQQKAIGFSPVDKSCSSVKVRGITGNVTVEERGAVKARSVPTKGTSIAVLSGEGCEFKQPLRRTKLDSNIVFFAFLICCWIIRLMRRRRRRHRNDKRKDD